MTERLERLNQLYARIPPPSSCYRVISFTHRMSGWPETHSSMCTERILPPPIQMPPHSRHSRIFKRAFAHLMMHDSFSALFMLTDCVRGWLCRLDGAVRVRACVRLRGGGAELGAREEWLCETATDRQMGVGGWGSGGEGVRDWGY